MFIPSSVPDIEQMIRDQVQENIHLDYKASAALTLAKRDEIAKDVSAFANSDGGVLIYGVEEKNNLPVRIDGGVDDLQVSREWLDNTVSSRITPKISDVRILPLPTSPGRSLYVISVVKSFRGPHQSADKKYYKRHNFKSEPMEDYEIADVRNRRQRVSTLITFEIAEYRRSVAAFDVRNVGDVVAEDVSFEFTKTLPWPFYQEGKMPPLFAQGTPKFPPKQGFRFLYFPFHEILSGAKGVPMQFSVRISYYHPDLSSRIIDEWPVNFAIYEHSTGIRPESEEQARDIIEALGKLNDNLVNWHKALSNFATIRGSTGLDLSIPTLRNLKRVFVDGGDPERIHPQGCDPTVFREILGVDQDMAHNIFVAIGWHYTPEALKDIQGMTDEIMAKIRAAFVLPPES